MAYRQDVTITGVILNRVAGARHLSLIEPAFGRSGLKLFGALGDDKRLMLPERHLGLVQAAETADLEGRLDALADAVAASVDLSAIEASARKAVVPQTATVSVAPPGQRIALASDLAFSFMYPHLLEQWRAAGAEIRLFSPLADEAPAADADVVWLPGGYPELHAGKLAAAARFRSGLCDLAACTVPIHGECGGYMVLGDGIVDATGERHAMAGLLRLETSFAARRLHLGYRRARLCNDCALGRQGSEVLGHEFHYASIITAGDEPLVDCRDAYGKPVTEAGARRGSVSGTFFHLLSMGSP
jgi:cobyrinic acid a,c-diamide synthase